LRVGLVFTFAAGLTCTFSAFAQGVDADTRVDTLELIQTPPEANQRRVELRRALSAESGQDSERDRRKLSSEEREALHRDLRATMRNVNADHDGRRP